MQECSCFPPSHSPWDPWSSEGRVLMPAMLTWRGQVITLGWPWCPPPSSVPSRVCLQAELLGCLWDLDPASPRRRKPGLQHQACSRQAVGRGVSPAGAWHFRALLHFLSAPWFGEQLRGSSHRNPSVPAPAHCSGCHKLWALNKSAASAKRSILTLQTISLNLSSRRLSGQSSTFPISWVLG